MPGPQLDPVESNANLPEEVDVVVIGGGIAGVCAALELIDRGKTVAICEKGEIGAEQSSRNWGWVRLTHRDPREMPLMVESVRLWKAMNDRIGGETGYRQTGVTYTVTTDAALAAEQHAMDDLQSYQVPARLMTREEVREAFPGFTLDITGALHNPHDGRAEPQKAAPAIARGVQERGGTVHQNCAVRTLETKDGKVTGVVTELGTIKCSAVLLAGGVWSRLFLGNLGIYLPQLRTKNTVMRTDPVEDGPEENLKAPGFALRKRLDGGYNIASSMPSRYQLTPDSFRLFKAFLPTLKNEWRSVSLGIGPAFFEALRTPRRWTGKDVSPFEKTRILDPKPNAPMIDKVLDLVRGGYAPFKSAKVAQRWAGYIDVLPDVIPVISETEGVKNGIAGLYVATGFSGHGFGLGTGAGLLAADLITGKTPCVDPTPFRLHRFTDGSKISAMENILKR
ncbi:NAD(P)/FAD-dependent oxidoreductase [Celeribacter litoreus]|uniref:NAD(P)/FAD-dependent oxidoreductase n=1 Tax=Celeribacter litoreus TaxID=2876714 RepID=UPI001CCDC5DE|nr:FAD-binding oxidoreductase [Celeribacter litoreus]MCA0043496.1 FAD-binding oxidoreductase [Celeribacter litoreus]